MNQVRWCSKRIQTRKYRQPHFENKLALALCEPVRKIDRRPSYERCSNARKAEKAWQVHPWEEMIAADLKSELLESRLVAFYHMNAMKSLDRRSAVNMLFKKGFMYRQFARVVYQMAIKDTKYASLSTFLNDSPYTCLVTSRTENVGELLKLDKKMPDFVLLFGVVDDKILRKDELIAYSQLSSLEQQHANLCATLDSSAQAVSSNIGYHLSMLSSNLEQYVKQNSSESEKETIE